MSGYQRCLRVAGAIVHAVFIVVCFVDAHATAEPMHFEINGTGGNHCCRWIQATGDITAETPKQFEAFITGRQYLPGVVRLNSTGGSLVGGVALGETFRAHSMSTQVGSSEFHADLVSMSGKENAFTEAPGLCASACAYAFLGGVERELDPDAKLGFHRFYLNSGSIGSSTKMFTGRDLDDDQKIVAALAFYMVRMGVDARLIILASQAGPNEIKWLSADEASEYHVTYQPSAYKPWKVEPYAGGAIAVSETNDSNTRVVAGCTKRLGPYVAIIDASATADVPWFNQCKAMNVDGIGHPVFGARVDISRVQVVKRKDGGAVMRFQLPNFEPPLTTPELLTFDLGYPMSCSTNRYKASSKGFAPAVRLALHNCYQD